MHNHCKTILLLLKHQWCKLSEDGKYTETSNSKLIVQNITYRTVHLFTEYAKVHVVCAASEYGFITAAELSEQQLLWL